MPSELKRATRGRPFTPMTAERYRLNIDQLGKLRQSIVISDLDEVRAKRITNAIDELNDELIRILRETQEAL